MPTRDLVIDPSAGDFNQTQRRVQQILEREAIDQLSLTGPAEVNVRGLLPAQDLESGGDNGWDGNDRQWEQTGMTNTGAETANVVYNIDSTANAENKLIAVYGISNVGSTLNTKVVEFRTGTGASILEVEVEGLYTDEETLGLLTDPVLYGADQGGDVVQFADGADDNVVYWGVVAEQVGETYEDAPRFLSDFAGGGAAPQGGGGA